MPVAICAATNRKNIVLYMARGLENRPGLLFALPTQENPQTSKKNSPVFLGFTSLGSCHQFIEAIFDALTQ